MVESQTLFEWSPDVAISLSTHFCSWVVAEDDNEDAISEGGIGSDKTRNIMSSDGEELTSTKSNIAKFSNEEAFLEYFEEPY
jgi:hypothetical protein